VLPLLLLDFWRVEAVERSPRGSRPLVQTLNPWRVAAAGEGHEQGQRFLLFGRAGAGAQRPAAQHGRSGVRRGGPSLWRPVPLARQRGSWTRARVASALQADGRTAHGRTGRDKWLAASNCTRLGVAEREGSIRALIGFVPSYLMLRTPW